jgi:flagellar assembly protein FliH
MFNAGFGIGEAARVGPKTVAAPISFTPWAHRLSAASPDPFADEELAADMAPPPAAPVIDPEAIALDGFAKGFEEGRRTLEAQLAEERVALARLAAAMEAARPEPPAALATVIGETVGFLLRQIVGEVEVDADLLRRRAEAAAALVAEESRPARMRLHPADLGRLADAKISLTLVPDAGLSPGSIVVESRDGWIEDGPQVALERLQVQLSALAVPR